MEMYLSTYHNVDEEVNEVFESTKCFWRAGFNPNPIEMMEMGASSSNKQKKTPNIDLY